MWGTGLYTAREQGGLRQDLLERIETRDADIILPGDAYAILEIPRIDLDAVVVEGTDTASLKRGPGHYPETAHPWRGNGRVGIAGHRTTYGAPFWDLDRVRPGDEIVLRTERGAFAYEVRRAFEVAPTQTEVLRPTRRPTLVLTTCTPRFSAARRLIVVADRVDEPVPA
jgi:sortase A